MLEKRILIFCFLIIFLAGCKNVNEDLFKEKNRSLELGHASYFRDEKTYEAFYREEIEATDEKIIGGILPHHLFVGYEHAKYFQFLDKQDPKTVVVIGPNHNSFGTSDVQISDMPYYTPYGELDNDKDIVSNLLDLDFIKKENKSFETEHSISSEVAFIKKHFPKTKIVPIILKLDTNIQEVESLAIKLDKILGKKSLVFASVDFSHYQPEIVADLHDENSLNTIQNFNFDNIHDLEIDSPASLYSVLKYLELRNSQSIIYNKHTNSASYSSDPSIAETTSHFFLAFKEGEKETEDFSSMLLFGDLMLDRDVRNQIEEHGADYIFRNIAGLENRFFLGNNYNIANLEGNITSSTRHQSKAYNFNHSIEGLEKLKTLGFNVFSIANNHIYDYYKKGYEDTIDNLKGLGFKYFGDNKKPCYKLETFTQSISVCAFDDTIMKLDLDKLKKTIEEEKNKSDKLVVGMHWGFEYATKSNERQKKIAHLLIDSGVDLVYGHHPHTIQEFEMYEGKPIIYSLGNFIFDQYADITKIEMALGVVMKENETVLYFYPMHSNYSSPSLYDYEERTKFYKSYLKDFESDSDLDGKIVLNF